MASNNRTFNSPINDSSTSRAVVDAESRYSIHRRAASGGIGVDVYGRVLPVRYGDGDGRVDPDRAPVAALFDDPERF